jgi:hypothetical protein
MVWLLTMFEWGGPDCVDCQAMKLVIFGFADASGTTLFKGVINSIKVFAELKLI